MASSFLRQTSERDEHYFSKSDYRPEIEYNFSEWDSYSDETKKELMRKVHEIIINSASDFKSRDGVLRKYWSGSQKEFDKTKKNDQNKLEKIFDEIEIKDFKDLSPEDKRRIINVLHNAFYGYQSFF